MVDKVKLRDYQQSILDRLEVVKTDDAMQAANYLGVEVSGRNVLVNLLDISETLVLGEVATVPLVKPWFLGMTNVRGVLYAINDLAQLLDDRYSPLTSNTRLLLINDSITANVGVLVDRLIGLRSIDNFEQKGKLEQGHICFSEDIYEDEHQTKWHVLDTVRLIESKEFETPYIT